MSLTDRDMRKISETVTAAIKEERSDFWVEPEEHYIHHKQLGELFSFWSETKSTVLKFAAGLALLGLLAALVVAVRMKTGT